MHNKRLLLVLELCAALLLCVGFVWYFTNSSPNSSATTNTSTETTTDGELQYRVTQVVDGDTLWIESEEGKEKIRLIGINAPEINHPSKGVECFGTEAFLFATELAHDTVISYQTDPSQGTRDKYDRLLAYVTLEDGRDLGEVLIRQGYAYEYTYNQRYANQTIYKLAQKEAEVTQSGLWAPGVCE